MRTPVCLHAFAVVIGVGFGLGFGLSLGACRGDKAAPPSGSGSGSATATAAAAGVEIFINDSSVAKIEPAQVATWPRLDTLVPSDVRKLGTWEVVALVGTKPTPTEVAHPSASYPDMVPAIFPSDGDGGGVSFGMFDTVELARKGKAAMREDHVKAIRIKVAQGGNRGQNDDGGGAAADPTKLVVTVKTPAGTTTLTGDKLLALPREPMPGNPDQKGWRLGALLDAAGVKTYEHLVLSDASGTNLTLDKKDLDDNTVPFIKLNKSGSLRFRVLKKAGDGWNPGGDLRGLVAIEAK